MNEYDLWYESRKANPRGSLREEIINNYVELRLV